MVASMAPLPRPQLGKAMPPNGLEGLSVLENIAAAATAAVPAVALTATRPLGVISSGSCGVLWILLLSILRLCRKVQKVSRRLVSAEAAAVEGSRFTTIDNVCVHYLVHDCASACQTSAPPPVLHFNHGFGANALTWDGLIEPLCSATCECTTEESSAFANLRLVAHDRIGFGLTSRPNELSKYHFDYNADLALQLLAQVGSVHASDSVPTPSYVLVGHSLGAVLSAKMAISTLGNCVTPQVGHGRKLTERS